MTGVEFDVYCGLCVDGVCGRGFDECSWLMVDDDSNSRCGTAVDAWNDVTNKAAPLHAAVTK
jgi:hypothetical protein